MLTAQYMHVHAIGTISACLVSAAYICSIKCKCGMLFIQLLVQVTRSTSQMNGLPDRSCVVPNAVIPSISLVQLLAHLYSSDVQDADEDSAQGS